MIFDKWKFIFYSKLAQLSRQNKLFFHLGLNKYFPNIYEIRNAYLRNYIKNIKEEFYILSNTSLFVWSAIMKLFFSTFFYKKINLKKVIIYFVIILCLILLLIIVSYVFIFKLNFLYGSNVIDILPLFSIISIKLISNIFNYLIFKGM